MPEGPEIHRAADRVRAALVGHMSHSVFFGQPHLAPLADGLTGQRVLSVTAHGKAMLTGFEDGRAVFSHNQLYGRWYVVKAGQRPSTRRSLRFAVENDARAALLYSASTLEVLAPDELGHHPFLAKLGPDPLHDDVDEEDVDRQLKDRSFRGRALGALLLDQGFVAGLGNYLRTEILFVARLRPERRPKELTPAQSKALRTAILAVTRQAYATGGITNDLERVAQLKAAGARRGAYRHWAFGRAGQPCPRCKTKIEQHTVGGRRLYMCPRCQKNGPRSRRADDQKV